VSPPEPEASAQRGEVPLPSCCGIGSVPTSGGVPLGPDEVHVWLVLLDLPREFVDRLATALSEEERTKASRFRFPLLRSRFIVAHATLRSVLASYCSKPARTIRFATDHYGKPALAGPVEAATAGSSLPVQFNLSHSEDCALVAVTRGRAVGVDVEQVSAEVDSAALAERYLASEERDSLERRPRSERNRLFFRYWVAKESYIKATGVGLSQPLDQFVVDFCAGRIIGGLATPDSQRAPIPWHVQAFNPLPGYVAAVTTEGASNPAMRLAWSPPRLA
jgi:4'-phosphopantetheinyl transferase